MSATIEIYVETAEAQIALGFDTVKLYRDTSPAGDFQTLVGSASLVSGTDTYSISDESGVAGRIYRYKFTGAAVLDSPFSEAFSVTGTDLRTLRFETAALCGLAFEGTCTSDGSSDTLFDEVLVDSGNDTDFLSGAWVYRKDADPDSDKLRGAKKAPFTVATGGLQMSRAWDTPPVQGEAYQVFMALPPKDIAGQPFSWDRVVREGLREVDFVDQVSLGLGLSTGEKRFSLGAFDIGRNDIRHVYLRKTNDDGVVTEFDASRMGWYWRLVENGPDGLAVEINPPPSTTMEIVVEALRRDWQLFVDDDVTACPFDDAIQHCVAKAYEVLNRFFPGKYAQELAGASQAAARRGRHTAPGSTVKEA